MPTFAYRLLPPRAAFWATIEPGEVALMVRHLEHLRRLKEEGAVRFVGRAENGDYGFVLIEADDQAHANRIATSDPAVSEGLMRLELHAFLVVYSGEQVPMESGTAKPVS
ncbi:YciI family protein [Rubellimicrobium arenae]|uniref:YciI family protein n=1 Tax=Rubellimicrobium arenae TaxID=2817372 RepID=UPI001B3029C3|nr:YciI family protein [Rubellimicrobium arenae]